MGGYDVTAGLLGILIGLSVVTSLVMVLKRIARDELGERGAHQRVCERGLHGT